MQIHKKEVKWKYIIKDNGGDIMEMNTKEVLKKKILDSQEMVRDYEMYSKQVENQDVAFTFKDFAEECGYQAKRLQEILKEIDNK